MQVSMMRKERRERISYIDSQEVMYVHDHMPTSHIDRIHPNDRPVVASSLKPSHAPIVQRPIIEAHDITLARRPWKFHRGRDRIRPAR